MRVLFLLLLLLKSFSQLCAQQITERPNILFIAIDDLKPTIGVYGDTYAQTPHLDNLGTTATVFLNNHCQQAICGPSRASIMTGQRPDHTQVWDLKTRMRDVKPTILTLPQYFKQQGYFTTGIGKIFDPRCVDKQSDASSWSEPFTKAYKLKYPKEYGAPVFGYYQNASIKKEIASRMEKAKKKGIRNAKAYVMQQYKPPFEKSAAPDTAYADGAIATAAIEKLKSLSQNSKKPFFLAVGFKRPHLPFVAPQRYWDLYDPNKITLAPYQKKSKNGPDIAYHKSGETRSYKDPNITYKTGADGLLKIAPNVQRDLIHGYYACTSFIDAQIGRILEKLKKENLDKNTIIVVWGDHGWHLGDHSLWNKHSNFEQATRSPLLIYNPFNPSAAKVKAPSEFVDVFPTLCAMSQLPIPKQLDGMDLTPLMEGTQSNIKDVAVSQWSKGKNTGYSFRDTNYRYTCWLKANKKSTDGIRARDIWVEELYDYVNDPLETTNQVKNKDYQSVYNKMKKYALQYFKEQEISKEKTVTVASDLTLKDLLLAKFDPKQVYVGATLNHRQLNTTVSDLFLKHFTYTTPENCAKQSRVHPKPNQWDWSQIDTYLTFAKKNNLTVRIHGPISPQASKWAKADHRTAKELTLNMTEYFTALCNRINKNENVKWMDVVNETVNRDGTWFSEKSGVDSWENPWVQIGMDTEGIPLYITKAFEIANKYAPDKNLVFNQHGGMEPRMWERVKKTILYLKSKGYRVDGLGWQAHLKSTDKVALNKKDMRYFSELIDWAHANDLDFHVTEIDYKIWNGKKTKKALDAQAAAYANVLKILLSKRTTGVVTYNTWGMVDGTGKHKDKHMFLFDNEERAKPAFYAVQETLKNPNTPLIFK